KTVLVKEAINPWPGAVRGAGDVDFVTASAEHEVIAGRHGVALISASTGMVVLIVPVGNK
ncbi:MAG: hypothetical protein FWC10_09535, partial [Lentimicrobiaceae bacterium]|nr:hypothetical protein [Lentimicrobiaceae bacterium]